jgi:VanZ family protein
MKLKYYLFYWLPVYLYAGLIFFLSSLSDPTEKIGVKINFLFADKITHFFIYGFLCFLIIRALSFSKKNFSIKSIYLISIIFSTLYGITDEIHQSFVPLRSVEISDIFANFLGAVFCAFLIQNTNYKYKITNNNPLQSKAIK